MRSFRLTVVFLAAWPACLSPLPSDAAQKEKALDERLLDKLNEGEDIDPREAVDPLTQIGQRMKKVQKLIAEKQVSGPTQRLQQQIADELGKLIEQRKRQKKQASGGSKMKPSNSKQPNKQKGPSKSPPQGAQRPGNKSATNSTQQAGKTQQGQADMQRVGTLIKQVWGHLPQRMQQQLQNVRDEKFLPKYEKLIEDYYKRLAEDASHGT